MLILLKNNDCKMLRWWNRVYEWDIINCCVVSKSIDGCLMFNVFCMHAFALN